MSVRGSSYFWGALRALSTTTRRTLYDVLGVSPSSTGQEVKAQFYKLSLLYHPDRAGLGEEDAASRSWRLDKFIQIKDAYEVLSHDLRRRAYDRQHGIRAVNHVTSTANRPVWDPYPGYRHISSRFVYARHPPGGVGKAETRETPADRRSKWSEYSEADLERISAARRSSTHDQRQAASIRRNRIMAIMFIITFYYFIQYYEHGGKRVP